MVWRESDSSDMGTYSLDAAWLELSSAFMTFSIVLKNKTNKTKQWSDNEQSARKYELLDFEEEVRWIHQPSAKVISL